MMEVGGVALQALRIEAKSLASNACLPVGRKCSSSVALLNPQTE
jgi:hypothetical protein